MILSFDFNKKYVAYCLMNQHDKTIEKWGTVDIGCNIKDTNEFMQRLFFLLDDFNYVDYVIIKQPMKRNKQYMISLMIGSYYSVYDISVKFFRERYYGKKNMVHKFVLTQLNDEWKNWICGQKRLKQLYYCYLQATNYLLHNVSNTKTH